MASHVPYIWYSTSKPPRSGLTPDGHWLWTPRVAMDLASAAQRFASRGCSASVEAMPIAAARMNVRGVKSLPNSSRTLSTQYARTLGVLRIVAIWLTRWRYASIFARYSPAHGDDARRYVA